MLSKILPGWILRIHTCDCLDIRLDTACVLFFARWISDNYYSLWMVRDSMKAIRHVAVTHYTYSEVLNRGGGWEQVESGSTNLRCEHHFEQHLNIE